MTVTRDEIVQAAIAIVDEGGLAHLSLRRLGDRLGIGASTLYWHVRDKRHLLDLIAEEFTRHVLLAPPADDEDVWTWMEEWSRSLFANLLAHPDGARIMAGNRLSPDGFPSLERVLVLLDKEGFPPAEAIHVLLAVGGYVIGVALDVQEELNRPPDSDADEDEMAPYPLLSSAGYPGTQERFDHGLRYLFAGIRAAASAQGG